MVLCGLAVLNSISTFFCFRRLRINAEKEADAEKEAQNRPPPPMPMPSTDQVTVVAEPTTKKHGNNLLAEIFRYRLTPVGAVFLLFYTGTEVTIGNWGYTFLISSRSSDTVAMAHVMSGYWAGICAGRLFLGFVTHRFGEKRMVYCYLSVIVAMMVFLWFVPYVGANATG